MQPKTRKQKTPPAMIQLKKNVRFAHNVVGTANVVSFKEIKGKT